MHMVLCHYNVCHDEFEERVLRRELHEARINPGLEVHSSVAAVVVQRQFTGYYHVVVQVHTT